VEYFLWLLNYGRNELFVDLTEEDLVGSGYVGVRRQVDLHDILLVRLFHELRHCIC